MNYVKCITIQFLLLFTKKNPVTPPLEIRFYEKIYTLSKFCRNLKEFCRYSFTLKISSKFSKIFLENLQNKPITYRFFLVDHNLKILYIIFHKNKYAYIPSKSAVLFPKIGPSRI